MWMIVVLTQFDAVTVYFSRRGEKNHEGSARIADMRAEI
jgi:hypothetical protein